MEQFYKDFKFIIGFMVLTLVVLMVAGEKAQRSFLLITLLGMVLMNVDDFNNFLDNTFSTKEEAENVEHVSSAGVEHGGGGLRR